MPFINGRYYMNPAYGRVLEHGRRRENDATAANQENAEDGHWVTIDRRHVLIREPQEQDQSNLAK